MKWLRFFVFFSEAQENEVNACLWFNQVQEYWQYDSFLVSADGIVLVVHMQVLEVVREEVQTVEKPVPEDMQKEQGKQWYL